ncbi:MAG: hypothetical protein Rubg2KO_20310 [Rubricoccaceae bacterium]
MPTALSYVLVAVVYLAGAYAAAESGWTATVRLLKMQPGLGRATLIAAAEAFVGLGTGVLAVMVGLWLLPDRIPTLALAAVVGVCVGVFRQVRAFRAQAKGYQAMDRAEGSPSSARGAFIATELLREVRFGVAARVLGVTAVLIGVIAETLAQ